MDPNSTPPAQGQNLPPTPQSAIDEKDIQGKTPKEIIEIVAQKSEDYGKLKAEVEELRTYRDNTAMAVQVVATDPNLLKAVEESYKKRYLSQPQPTTQNQVPQNPDTPTTPPVDDTRKTLVDQIIKNFEKEKGINTLEGQTKKDLSVRIGQELFELVDPGGTKNYQEVINSIPLNKLETFFNKAYNLATLEDQKRQAQEQTKVEMQTAGGGIIGSMPSSSPVTETITLTPQERKHAKALGISEEKWLQRKKEIITSEEKGSNW